MAETGESDYRGLRKIICRGERAGDKTPICVVYVLLCYVLLFRDSFSKVTVILAISSKCKSVHCIIYLYFCKTFYRDCHVTFL